MNDNDFVMIPEEVIMSKIYVIRGRKVMLDMDLAEIYGVETKQLKRAVRRNDKRFPPDFMFELSPEEFENLRSQFGTSSWGGVRYSPMAFTEQGIAMLSSVLHSDTAIMANVQIIRIFTRMREMLQIHRDILEKLSLVDLKIADHDDKIILIFQYLKQLEQARKQQEDQSNRKLIGFRQKEG